ncbi:HAD domain-containing protein [Streptomyces sp. NPDC058221]|uniref:HAD domain-containing protein n=1 Tax=Streptomyces sp. NPDC058221 TaxID=3346388 RepID=UPI0036E54C10
MTGSGGLPLLFLDVDGPLIPFGPATGPGGRHPTYPAGPFPPGAGANPLLARIDPALGPRLAALGCELVWATTWTHEANEVVAPRLGLPELRVVLWPEPSAEEDRDARAGLHWKTRTLVARAAGRPFVWVDDEIGEADRRWVSGHHGGRSLLHRVDPGRGLTDSDFRLIGAWLRTV